MMMDWMLTRMTRLQKSAHRPLLAIGKRSVSPCSVLVAGLVLCVAFAGPSFGDSDQASELHVAGADDSLRRHIPRGGARKPPGRGQVKTRRDVLDALYSDLAAAPDVRRAELIAAKIEQLWAQSDSPTADLLVQRATGFIQKKQWKVAHRLLKTALDLRPDHVDGWGRTAHLLYLENKLLNSLGAIRRVLALEPKNFKALEGMASILLELGDKKNALKAYDNLLKVYPKKRGVRKLRDRLFLEVEGRRI